MDPDKALRVMRAAITDSRRRAGKSTERASLLEAVEAADALDAWLSKGGFLPEDWTQTKPSRARDFLFAHERWAKDWAAHLDKLNPDGGEEDGTADDPDRPSGYAAYDEARADLGEDAEVMLDRAIALLRELTS